MASTIAGIIATAAKGDGMNITRSCKKRTVTNRYSFIRL